MPLALSLTMLPEISTLTEAATRMPAPQSHVSDDQPFCRAVLWRMTAS